MKARIRTLPAVVFLIAISTVLLAGDARACDTCAVYSAAEYREARPGLRLGVAEQFTNYGTFVENGKEAPNLYDQYLRSSITQFFAAYTFTPSLSAQVTLPLISRWYRRTQDVNKIQEDNLTGIGDIALLGRWNAWSHVDETSIMRFSLLAGLKLPSGNTNELRSEQEEAEAEQARGAGLAKPAHGEVGGTSAVGGDDLTLGSGSVDGIVGGQFFSSWNRYYLSMIAQYAIRGTGAYDYRFANDLFWFVGPGVYILTEHAYTLAGQAVVSGDTKGGDVVDGESVSGSGRTSLFVGPAISFSWESNLSVELAGDIPVVNNAAGTTLLPDYRIRAALSWQF